MRLGYGVCSLDFSETFDSVYGVPVGASLAT